MSGNSIDAVFTLDFGLSGLAYGTTPAEKPRIEAAPPRGYQPIEGPAAYNQAVQKLVFGADSPLLSDRRAVTIQTLGDTGGLKVGAAYLKRLLPSATVYLSDPSWENHRALFEAAGSAVENYPYYDAATRGVDFAGMMAKLGALPSNLGFLRASVPLWLLLRDFISSPASSSPPGTSLSRCP